MAPRRPPAHYFGLNFTDSSCTRARAASSAALACAAASADCCCAPSVDRPTAVGGGGCGWRPPRAISGAGCCTPPRANSMRCDSFRASTFRFCSASHSCKVHARKKRGASTQRCVVAQDHPRAHECHNDRRTVSSQDSKRGPMRSMPPHPHPRLDPSPAHAHLLESFQEVLRRHVVGIKDARWEAGAILIDFLHLNHLLEKFGIAVGPADTCTRGEA
jgi:hypothetical protein